MAKKLNQTFGTRVTISPIKDANATSNFEVIAQTNNGPVALHEKVGKGQGHVDTDEKVMKNRHTYNNEY